MKTLRFKSKDGEIELSINYRINPTPIQQVLYEDNKDLLISHGGEFTDYKFDIDGQRVHYLKTDKSGIILSAIGTLKFNDKWVALN